LSPVVQNYLRAHSNGWTPETGQALLVLAEQASPDVADLAAVRVEAWSFAERVVIELFDRYAAAERAVEAETTAEHGHRLAKAGTLTPAARATERRPS
jgi:hypothetical protein